jgi:anti-anti-sigma regulatory factor
MPEDKNTLSYNISGNDAVLIVNLSGKLDLGCSSAFQFIQQTILEKNNLQGVILNFAHVEAVTIDAFTTLTQFQKFIRAKPSELRLCSMKIHIKEKMSRSGIVRKSEISETAKEAIYSLFGSRSAA